MEGERIATITFHFTLNNLISSGEYKDFLKQISTFSCTLLIIGSEYKMSLSSPLGHTVIVWVDDAEDPVNVISVWGSDN